jgi:hypothetical protein
MISLKNGMEVDASGKPISVAEARIESALSSLLPDQTFRELRQVQLTSSSGNFAALTVHGTVRYTNKGSRCGTVVVIFTHLGEITLDGSDIYFEETIVNSFNLAGFEVADFEVTNFGARRQLSTFSVAVFTGLFNAIAEIKEARCTENANNIEGYNGLRDGPLPLTPTDEFTFDWTTYTECDTSTPSKRDWCSTQVGVDEHPSDYPQKLFYTTNKTMTMQAAGAHSVTSVSWANRQKHFVSRGNGYCNWETDTEDKNFNCACSADVLPLQLAFGDTAVYHGDSYMVRGESNTLHVTDFQNSNTPFGMCPQKASLPADSHSTTTTNILACPYRLTYSTRKPTTRYCV